MNRCIAIIVFLSAAFTLPGDEYTDFRLLTPDEQVQKVLADFRYTGFLGFEFVRLRNIIMENPEKIKPIIFKLFEDIPPFIYGNTSDVAYDIISNIMNEFIIEGLLNKDEMYHLGDLYQKHVEYYLKTYKKIDALSIALEALSIQMKTGVKVKLIPGYEKEFLKRYTDRGYKDLWIDDYNITFLYNQDYP
jgi:hypothetical protein